MKKLLAIIAISCAAVQAQAQHAAKSMRIGAEFGIGSQVELNVRGEYPLARWLSWDVVAVKYAHELGAPHANKFGVKSGLRGYLLPTRGLFNIVMAVDLGYNGATAPHADWSNAFGLDLTTGFCFFRRMYFGYGFSLSQNKGGNDKDHTFRIGYLF